MSASLVGSEMCIRDRNKEETEEKQSEQKVITGTDLRKLFGS
ncbi:hypothetical protein JMUB7537_28140 [Staphylococcus aureus]